MQKGDRHGNSTNYWHELNLKIETQFCLTIGREQQLLSNGPKKRPENTLYSKWTLICFTVLLAFNDFLGIQMFVGTSSTLFLARFSNKDKIVSDFCPSNGFITYSFHGAAVFKWNLSLRKLVFGRDGDWVGTFLESVAFSVKCFLIFGRFFNVLLMMVIVEYSYFALNRVQNNEA